MSTRNPYALDEPTWEAIWETRSDAERHPDPKAYSVEHLLRAVEEHAAAEEDALSLYQHIGERSGDPVVALVMELILDDERRHHALLGRMATSLRNALEWRHEPGALPSDSELHRSVDAELITTTRELIREEHEGARYLRELGEKQRGHSAGLAELLLQMMAMDSDKHAYLLRFVEARLKHAAHLHDAPGD